MFILNTLEIMKKKVMSLLIVIASLTLSFGTYASAAPLDEVGYVGISPRVAYCSYCGTGHIITSTKLVSSIFDHNEICTTRPDCVITVTRNDYATVVRCDNCGIGTTSYYYTYTRTHSKSH